MSKSLFLIFIGLIFGWFFHILYTKKENKNTFIATAPIETKDCSNSDETITYEVIEKEVIKFVPKTKIVYRTKESKKDINASKEEPFLLALKEKRFYDAMSYYEEAEEEKHKGYQTALVGYFSKEQISNPLKAIEEMRYFIEMEAESKIIVFQLAQIFEKKGRYAKALDVIVNYSYIAPYQDKIIINTKIKSISMSYISKLTDAKSFKVLIDFLINQINVGVLSDFFSFELAKAYIKLKKYLDSLEILNELKNNDIYKERAIKLLSYIQIKLEELEEYPIQIPLTRSGSHFLVRATVNNIPVLLMIDTGASITTINYNIIQNLEVIKQSAIFHTAGGQISETIFKADTFTIGSIALSDFTVASSHFPSTYQDGLLGMNFLTNFKFKINQEEAILLLGRKY